VRFTVTYTRSEDLIADVEQQFARGGLLVKAESDPLERDAAVELELVTPHGKLVMPASVIAMLGAAQVALAFDTKTPALLELIAAARRDLVGGMLVDDSTPAEPPAAQPEEAEDEDEVGNFGSEASVAQKSQIALHGDRTQRMAILRDTNKTLHGYVLRNPNLQLEEVSWIARQATMSAEVLTQIANRREWIAKPEIVASLVRNPKTPIPLAVKLLELVAPAELRLLAKQTNVRDAVQRAARKKLLG
jgi:hypothetical protein